MNRLKFNMATIKKSYIILLTITLAIAFALSGCSLVPNGDNAKFKDTESTVDTNSETTTNESNVQNVDLSKYNIPMKSTPDKSKTETQVNFTANSYSEFKNYIDGINTIYEFSDLYNFSETINEYNHLTIAEKHSSKLQKIAANDLYELVKNNNKEYKKISSTAIYKELKDDELKEICTLIADTTEKIKKQSENVSEDRLRCVLSDLKIFAQTSSVANAFVTDDNSLIVSPNMMEIATLIKGDSAEKDVLIHEIVHLSQKGCNCDLQNNTNLKRNFGVSYGFKNVKVNSLDFTWLYEASAEKNMHNLTGHDFLVYQNMIGYLESLSLVNLLNDNFKVNDTEKLSYKRTLDDLYNFFGVEDEKDKSEVLNLMYSIEVMQQAPEDFYKVLTEKTGKTKDDTLIDEVNYNVKASICETLTKMFYANMAKNIVNKDISLEDIFYLISIWENDLNSHLKYSQSNKYKYNANFIEIYLNIQNNFFSHLSKATNLTTEEIQNKFNEYTVSVKSKNGEIVANHSSDFLSSSKMNYLETRKNDLSLSAAPTIKNISIEFNK